MGVLFMGASTSLVVVGFKRDSFEEIKLNALEAKVKRLFNGSYEESSVDSERKTFIITYDKDNELEVDAKYELVNFIRGIQRHVMQDFILMSTLD